MDQLDHGFKTTGIYEYKWNASAYPSGMYLAKLNLNNTLYSHKLILMK